MIALAQSLVAYSYNVFAIANGNGTPFALLSKAQQVTWQTSFGSAPGAINIIIETSLDNVSWSTVATTTATAGATGTFVTSAIFIRASIVSHTGGDTVTVGIVAKVGILGIVTPASVTSGSLVEFDGTTGSKFKELVFSGDDTEFLNGDGAFTAPISGGTPSLPLNSIQFNNAGSFGGDSGLVWDSVNDELTITQSGGASEVVKIIQASENQDGLLILNAAATLPNRGFEIQVKDTSDVFLLSHAGGVKLIESPAMFEIITDTQIDGNLAVGSGKTIQGAFLSSDTSVGITQDVTTGTLVGKTMTFKDGILVGFA